MKINGKNFFVVLLSMIAVLLFGGAILYDNYLIIFLATTFFGVLGYLFIRQEKKLKNENKTQDAAIIKENKADLGYVAACLMGAFLFPVTWLEYLINFYLQSLNSNKFLTMVSLLVMTMLVILLIVKFIKYFDRITIKIPIIWSVLASLMVSLFFHLAFLVDKLLYNHVFLYVFYLYVTNVIFAGVVYIQFKKRHHSFK